MIGGPAEISGVSSISDLIADALLKYIIPTAAILAVGVVIYGGLLYIMSSGDPEKTQKAKKTLIWAIVAVIIIVLTIPLVSGLVNIMETEILK